MFSGHYCSSNPEVVGQFVKGADTVLLLAFATVLLNTDLHNSCIRPEHKMTFSQFVRNLRGTACAAVWFLLSFLISVICKSLVMTRAHSFLWQILRASLQNSAAHHSRIVQIPWLTAAFLLCIN